MFFSPKDHLGDKIFKKFPFIEINENLQLRDIRLSDCQEYFDYINHPKVKIYVPDSCLPASPEAAKKELQFFRDLHNRRTSVYWAIVDGNNKMIGACGFEKWSRIHNRLELAYDLNPEFWRQGIMYNSLKKIIGYAFNVMQCERIEAFLKPDNIASAKLLNKLNFTKEATLKKYRSFKNEQIDVDLYAIIKDQWQD